MDTGKEKDKGGKKSGAGEAKEEQTETGERGGERQGETGRDGEEKET